GDRDGLRPDDGIRSRAERRRRGRRARPSGQRLLGDRRRRHPLPPHRAHRTDRCGALSRGLMAVSLALLAIRVLSAAFVVIQPGFTDAFYYVDVARRLAHGQGLTADFVWNFLEAPHLDPLPVASHRFWMPLATILQATGIAVLEPLLGTFRSAQAAIIAVAAVIPAVAYAAGRSIGASPRAALVAAALAIRPSSRVAGVAGSAVALAIGAAWLLRGIALGGSPDLLARTLFLARYEDFFAITPTGTADLATIVTTRLGALWSDFTVALFGLMAFLAFPLALGLKGGWQRPSVRAFAGLALLIYVAESFVWPLHATRGSYFHSLAAFYPFAMGLVALGGERWLARRDAATRRLAVGGTVAAAAALAVVGLTTWDATFNDGYRARAAALDAIQIGRA